MGVNVATHPAFPFRRLMRETPRGTEAGRKILDEIGAYILSVKCPNHTRGRKCTYCQEAR